MTIMVCPRPRHKRERICDGGTWSTDFPTTGGAYDTSYNGGDSDVFVSKLNSGLTSLLASTYLGGLVEEDYPYLTLDTSGNVYVTGVTRGLFPTTSGAYDTSYNGGYSDVFCLEAEQWINEPAGIHVPGRVWKRCGAFESFSRLRHKRERICDGEDWVKEADLVNRLSDDERGL